jgi:hypothetical protein
MPRSAWRQSSRSRTWGGIRARDSRPRNTLAAGELLGEEQSGQIQEIGFALYMELLERAVPRCAPDAARTRATAASRPEIELHVPALLPDSFLPDVLCAAGDVQADIRCDIRGGA